MRIDEVIAYHGTVADIDQFRPLSHFGSQQAARDRMAYKKIDGKIYQVDLDINNPAIIKDFPGSHTPRQFAFALHNAKIFTEDEMLSISKGEENNDIKTTNLIKLLKSKGYDGIAYKNRYEDKGHISYVILDSSQAKIIDIIFE